MKLTLTPLSPGQGPHFFGIEDIVHTSLVTDHQAHCPVTPTVLWLVQAPERRWEGYLGDAGPVLRIFNSWSIVLCFPAAWKTRCLSGEGSG